jgi:hypothetical protein
VATVVVLVVDVVEAGSIHRAMDRTATTIRVTPTIIKAIARKSQKRRPVKSARRQIMKQINVIFAMRKTISTVGDQQELMVLIQIGMRTAGPLTISPANLTR